MVIRTAFPLDVPSERCGWVGREFPPRCLHLGRNVGGFIGHSRGVDKIDEVLMCRSGVCISPDFFSSHRERGSSLRSEPGVCPSGSPCSAEGDAALLPQELDRRGRPPAGFWLEWLSSRRSPAQSLIPVRLQSPPSIQSPSALADSVSFPGLDSLTSPRPQPPRPQPLVFSSI